MKSKIIDEDISKIIPYSEDYLRSLEGKTLLITGANGFIPSYLVDTFIEFNKRLKSPIKLILINKNPINKKSRLSHLLGNPNVHMVAQDVGEKFDVPGKPNIIIHAASNANPSLFLKKPRDTLDSNVQGTRTLLDYAKDNPVENFVFFSSAEIYGFPPKDMIPTNEMFNGNVDCLSPKACYSESKRFSETLCSVFNREYNIPTKILRLFHTYGPGLRNDGKVITDFFNSSRRDKEIILKDRGESIISFCYISDSIRGILKVMSLGKNGEAYNIGDDTSCIKIKNLAGEIGKTMNNNTVVRVNEKIEDKNNHTIAKRMPEISKLRELGFSPEVKLKDGLLRTKQHLDEALS